MVNIPTCWHESWIGSLDSERIVDMVPEQVILVYAITLQGRADVMALGNDRRRSGPLMTKLLQPPPVSSTESAKRL